MRASLALLLTSLAAFAVAAPYPQDEPEVPEVESSALPEPVSTTVIVTPGPTLPVSESTSLNIPVTATTALETDVPSSSSSLSSSSSWSRTRSRRPPHSEPVPIFSKSCDCPNLATMAYPCWATDALQRCNFEELHSFICWTSANYGCPTPTRSCESLFSPTPITTGKNPCEIGPGGNEPMITGAPMRRWQDMVAKL